METSIYRLVNNNFFCYTCQKGFKTLCDPTRLQSVNCSQCHGNFIELIPYKAQYPEGYPIHSSAHNTTAQSNAQAREETSNRNRMPRHEGQPRQTFVEFVFFINPIFFFGAPGSQGEQTHPATKEAIDKLEKVSVNQAIVDKGAACAVCCSNFKEGEEVQKWPCKHMFHSGCTKPWLEAHNTCPVCRHELPSY